jgi:hypothetical protein
MSTTPRKNRSDKERRRRARVHGLKPSATWSEVEAATMEQDSFIRMAARYGLGENATWDEIYAAFCNKINEGTAAIKAARVALITASPFLLLMFVWMHWLTIAIAIVVFLGVFLAMFMGYGHENGEHAYHMLRHPEIKERARRDSLFGLSEDD